MTLPDKFCEEKFPPNLGDGGDSGRGDGGQGGGRDGGESRSRVDDGASTSTPSA